MPLPSITARAFALSLSPLGLNLSRMMSSSWCTLAPAGANVVVYTHRRSRVLYSLAMAPKQDCCTSCGNSAMNCPSWCVDMNDAGAPFRKSALDVYALLGAPSGWWLWELLTEWGEWSGCMRQCMGVMAPVSSFSNSIMKSAGGLSAVGFMLQ